MQARIKNKLGQIPLWIWIRWDKTYCYYILIGKLSYRYPGIHYIHNTKKSLAVVLLSYYVFFQNKKALLNANVPLCMVFIIQKILLCTVLFLLKCLAIVLLCIVFTKNALLLFYFKYSA
jgi:hypothetical protein